MAACWRVFVLYVGFKVSYGCSMGVFYKDFEVPKRGDMCGMCWGSSVLRGFFNTEFGDLLAVSFPSMLECMRDLLDVKGCV